MTIHLDASRRASQRCAVCGAGDAACLLDGLLSACRVCAFTWTRAQLPPSKTLYHSGYFEGEGYQDYYQPADREYEAGRRLRWLLRTSSADTMIEAGAAGGYLVAAARDAGIDAEGVELSASAAAFAQGRLGVPVHAGSFESATFSHRYDGFRVIAADTLFSRYYWRPWARWRHVRELRVAYWVASGHPSVRHQRLRDAIRLIACRPTE